MCINIFFQLLGGLRPQPLYTGTLLLDPSEGFCFPAKMYQLQHRRDFLLNYFMHLLYVGHRIDRAVLLPFLATKSPVSATLSRILATMSPVSATMSPFSATLSLVWTGLNASNIADRSSCAGGQQSRLLQLCVSTHLLDRLHFLQSVRNAAARLVSSARRSEHISPLLRELVFERKSDCGFVFWLFDTFSAWRRHTSPTVYTVPPMSTVAVMFARPVQRHRSFRQLTA